MRTKLSLLLLLLGIAPSYAQTTSTSSDIVKGVNTEYMQQIFNPDTKTFNTSYNYSNKWDFDGDMKNDSIFFVGNGGVHTYFYLKIVLSSDRIVRNYPFIQLDMPYFETKESLDKYGKNPSVQFVVYDFDKDGISDLYLNIDNDRSTIPKEWKRAGVTTKNILISFAGNKLKVRNYNTTETNGSR